MIRPGIVGCRQWGQNFPRNLSQLPERAQIAAYANTDPKRVQALSLRYPSDRSGTRANTIFDDATWLSGRERSSR
jgi:hypothetical protein